MAGPPDLRGLQAEASEAANVAGNLRKSVSIRGLQAETNVGEAVAGNLRKSVSIRGLQIEIESVVAGRSFTVNG